MNLQKHFLMRLKEKKRLRKFISIDTGMSRIGFLAGENNEEIVDEIIKISKLPYIEIEGIFSHFATSDEYDKSYTLLQYGRFYGCLQQT